MSSHGKPFAKVSDEARRLFDLENRRDFRQFLGTIAEAATMRAAQFVDENKDNIVSQIANQPAVKGSIITIVQHAKTLRDEADARDAAEAADRAAREPK